MLLLLKNQLVMGRLVDGQFRDQVTDQNGLTINVKRPPRFVAGTGPTLQAQDIVTGSMPVAVDQYRNVHISVGDLEYVQSFNDLMQNQTMKSAAQTLATTIDGFLTSKTLGFHSWVAGVAPGNVAGNAQDPSKIIASPSQFMGAHSRLMSQGVPNESLSGVVSFGDGESIRGSLLSDFTPEINVSMLQKTKIPIISEVDLYATQQTPTLTTGTRTTGDGSSTGAQINTANQNVNYKDVKGSAGVVGMTQTLVLKLVGNNTTVALGEVFTIQNVFSWDWRLGAAHEYLQQFTVLAAGTADGSGNLTVTITPPIIVQGTNDGGGTTTNTAFATVDSIPAANAYVRWVGTASTRYRVKSAFHKRAIALVSARLQMPFTGTASFAVDPDTGVAIRYWRGSDITSGQHIHRWDTIYGAQVMDSFLGTRICGT
jgi:hypothetical protein